MLVYHKVDMFVIISDIIFYSEYVIQILNQKDLKILQKFSCKICAGRCYHLLGWNKLQERPEEFRQAWRLSRGENPKFPHLLFVCLPVYLFNLKLHNLNKPEVNYYRYHKSIFRHQKCTQVELPGRVWWCLNIQCLFFKKKLP